MLIKTYYKNLRGTWMANDFNKKEVAEIISIVKENTQYAFFMEKAEGFICKTEDEYFAIPEIIQNHAENLG